MADVGSHLKVVNPPRRLAGSHVLAQFALVLHNQREGLSRLFQYDHVLGRCERRGVVLRRSSPEPPFDLRPTCVDSGDVQVGMQRQFDRDRFLPGQQGVVDPGKVQGGPSHQLMPGWIQHYLDAIPVSPDRHRRC